MSHTFTTPSGGTRTVLADNPLALLVAATELRERALDNLRRADENIAEAQRWAEDVAAEKERARVQRNARAAATRAKNADPWGFKARGL